MFLRELREIYKEKIQIDDHIILLEPKISEEAADDACRKLGKTHCIHSEVDGFSGGV